MMKNTKFVVGLLLFSPLGFGAKLESRHCAEQLSVRVLDDALIARVESYLIKKQGKAPIPAAAMTRALNRRMVFFRGYEADQLWKLPEVCALRGICAADSLLLAADLVETLPSAADLYRSVSGRNPFPDFGGNWGVPYMLDILTLPAASVAAYLKKTDFSGSRPERKLIDGEGRPLPPAMDIAKERAKADAIQRGWEFVMENRNGTFTPLRLKPAAGSYFKVSGGSMSSGSAGGTPPALPKEASFAVIDDRTGSLRFVNSQPTDPNIEYLVLLNDQVIRHGITEGGVNENALRRRHANVLMEQLMSTGSFEAELTVYHRQALYVVLERMASDLIGAGAAGDANLSLSRNEVRNRLLTFLERQPVNIESTGNTFLAGLQRYLENADPLRKIHTLDELLPLLD